MDSADILQTIAEIGIGLAGFGGIAAGLGYRARGNWSVDDQVRLMAMAFASLLVVFACLVPFIVHYLAGGEPWRISALIILPFQAFNLAAYVWANRSGIPPSYNRAAVIVMLIIQIVAAAVLLSVSFDAGPYNQFGRYLLVVFLLLLLASILFIRLLITSFRGGPPATE